MPRPSSNRWLHLLAPLALSPLAAAQNVWHVDGDAPLGGTGYSWASPMNVLEKALTIATVGDEVWVAEGTYRPILRTNPADPRSATFVVPQAVRLYGGFDGTETSLDQRAGLFDTTILDGDIGVPNDASDNTYHVVSVNNPSGIPPGSTRIDGFKIMNGNADVPGNTHQGGGVWSWNSSTIVENCIVTENRAMHGAAFHAQPGALRIVRCTVTDNHATDKGGAMWGHAVNVRAVNSVFARNSAADKGGAIYLHSMAGPENGRFVNSLFYENEADVGGAVFLGGGMFSAGAATFQACTFALNRATTSGGGLRAVTGTTIPAVSRLYDCVVWRNFAPQDAQLHGDHTVLYSNVMGGASGTGNIAADPLFMDLAARDFRLAPGSPCIDAGDNEAVPQDWHDLDDDGNTTEAQPLDLADQPRFVDDLATPDTGSGVAPIVDMGCYEYQP